MAQEGKRNKKEIIYESRQPTSLAKDWYSNITYKNGDAVITLSEESIRKKYLYENGSPKIVEDMCSPMNCNNVHSIMSSSQCIIDYEHRIRVRTQRLDIYYSYRNEWLVLGLAYNYIRNL